LHNLVFLVFLNLVFFVVKQKIKSIT